MYSELPDPPERLSIPSQLHISHLNRMYMIDINTTHHSRKLHIYNQYEIVIFMMNTLLCVMHVCDSQHEVQHTHYSTRLITHCFTHSLAHSFIHHSSLITRHSSLVTHLTKSSSLSIASLLHAPKSQPCTETSTRTNATETMSRKD
jgi:hypothetical protein